MQAWWSGERDGGCCCCGSSCCCWYSAPAAWRAWHRTQGRSRCPATTANNQQVRIAGASCDHQQALCNTSKKRDPTASIVRHRQQSMLVTSCLLPSAMLAAKLGSVSTRRVWTVSTDPLTARRCCLRCWLSCCSVPYAQRRHVAYAGTVPMPTAPKPQRIANTYTPPTPPPPQPARTSAAPQKRATRTRHLPVGCADPADVVYGERVGGAARAVLEQPDDPGDCLRFWFAGWGPCVAAKGVTHQHLQEGSGMGACVGS